MISHYLRHLKQVGVPLSQVIRAVCLVFYGWTVIVRQVLCDCWALLMNVSSKNKTDTLKEVVHYNESLHVSLVSESSASHTNQHKHQVGCGYMWVAYCRFRSDEEELIYPKWCISCLHSVQLISRWTPALTRPMAKVYKQVREKIWQIWGKARHFDPRKGKKRTKGAKIDPKG